MGRPRTISDEALLDAARAVFLRDGAQASTAEIARAAGISEGLIFKRFSTKDELFHACFDISKAGASDLDRLVGKGELVDAIAAIALEQVQIFRRILPCVLMRMTHGGLSPRTLFSGATATGATATTGTPTVADRPAAPDGTDGPDGTGAPTLPEPLAEPLPVRLVTRVARYFEAEMALGRLRPADPSALARIVVGSTQNLVFFELAGLAQLLPTDDRAFCRTLAGTLLDGVRETRAAAHVTSTPHPSSSPSSLEAEASSTRPARQDRPTRSRRRAATSPEVPDAR
jgi:AcrR family transcriptional regulator